MDKMFTFLYRRKKIYTECARTVLADNYRYYSSLTDTESADRMYKEICTALQHSGTIFLYDKIGCSRNCILQKIAENYSQSHTVYIIEDDMCTGSILGIHAPSQKVYIFSFREPCNTSTLCYDLNGCYISPDRRRYSDSRYIEVANYFISCRYSIDKPGSIMI